MNLAYVSNSAIPSTEANSIQVMRMCGAFAEAGHSVTLYCRRGSVPAADVFAYYGVAPRFEFIQLPRPGAGAFGKAVYAARVLRAVASRPLPDLFYGRDPVSLAVAAAMGKPLVYEAHGLPRTAAGRWLHHRLFRRQNFKRLVITSQAVEQGMLKMFPRLKLSQVIVARNGVTLASSDASVARTDWVGRGDRLQVGYVGHLYAGKGMEVIALLTRKVPEADFHVVGGAEPDLARWRAQLNGTANLHLHGHVPPSQASAFQASMDVLLLPAQSNVGLAGRAEATVTAMSLPLKIFEYMAARRPIVASDLPVLREVVQHEVNALLVAPADVEAWASAIRRLAGDAALRKRLADAAYATVAANYTWQHRAQRVLQGIAR